MAGGRDLKGITVSIGADTTKLQSALAGVNKEVKNTQAQLKDVEKLLKLDPSNTELVRQKQKLLADAIKETKEKLSTLKTAAERNEPEPGTCRFKDQVNDIEAKGIKKRTQNNTRHSQIISSDIIFDLFSETSKTHDHLLPRRSYSNIFPSVSSASRFSM